MQDINKKQSRPPHPREHASIFSVLFFTWLLGTFVKGFRRDLEVEDLYEVLKEHRSERLGDIFERTWEKELLKAKKKNRRPSFLCVIVRVFFWRNVLYSAVLAAVDLGVSFSLPFFIGLLVRYFSISNQTLPYPKDGDPTYIARCIEIIRGAKSQIQKPEAFFYAGGIAFVSLLNVLVLHPYSMAVLHQGMKIRVGCCSIMYRKALRLSKMAMGDQTVGHVINLFSNDVNRFDIVLIFLHYLWIGPLETVIACYIMYEVIGWSTFLGVSFLLMLIPLQGIVGKRTSMYRLRTALRTDERVRLMNEIISGIQVIKMYAWEYPFADLVSTARRREIAEIRGAAFGRGVLLSFIIFSTRFALFLTLISYALAGDKIISAEKVFVLVSFYSILQQTMTVFFPMEIALLAEAFISVKRIQAFMLYEENVHVAANFPVEDSLSIGPKSGLKRGEVKFDSFTASWNPGRGEPTLNDVTLHAKRGKVLAAIGPVGSGKSSLLNAILMELPGQTGELTINGVISYASQEPWLFVGTVRQNILFGAEYCRRRYQRVVHACALERDFELMPYGDRTIIEERGVSLSGGQRARINLARAVYRNADIYLLDDPFSAVDTHVGKHMFDECVLGFLRKKTVILVTHQLQYLKNADYIIIFNNGLIEGQGTFKELQDSKLEAAKLLRMAQNPDDDDYERSTSEQESSSFSSSSSESSSSSISTPSSSSSEEGKLKQRQVEEHQTKGAVSCKVYGSYFSAVGNWCLVFLMIFFLVLTQVISSFSDYWCSKWAKDEELNENKTLEERREARYENIFVYSGASVAIVVVTLARSFLFFHVCMMASRNLHDNMFSNIICAPMRFFNTNPSGRVLNRFSKDIGSVDETLPSTMIDCFQIFLAFLGIVTVVALISPLLLVPTCVIGVTFYVIRIFYMRTSRSLKRLEGITKSPVFSHLSASLQGLTTIRAFKAQDILTKEFDSHQDLHSTSWYIFISASRAFGFWLDILCVFYITLVTFSFLFWDLYTGAEAGLAITQSLALTGVFQWGMRQSTELENLMTSVERILEYTTIEKEPPLRSPPDKRPPASWPSRGKIEFNKTYLRYDPLGKTVLRGLTVTIYPQEKIGIVGRTGSGKSTLIAALFRLAYNEGTIKVDGLDISQIGLHDLRSKMSIIPQEPVLFSGTLRYNLDPFDEHSDLVLWQALEEVELKDLVEENQVNLLGRISEGGANFSVGQRQLVCLARAIIRNNRILIMDEATANVDAKTDRLIQRSIRKKFKECTVLTIAHRLNTVMDSDRILVLDAGKVVEFDHPYILLKQKGGILRGMVLQMGPSATRKLHRIAKKSYELKLRKDEALMILQEITGISSGSSDSTLSSLEVSSPRSMSGSSSEVSIEEYARVRKDQ